MSLFHARRQPKFVLSHRQRLRRSADMVRHKQSNAKCFHRCAQHPADQGNRYRHGACRVGQLHQRRMERFRQRAASGQCRATTGRRWAGPAGKQQRIRCYSGRFCDQCNQHPDRWRLWRWGDHPRKCRVFGHGPGVGFAEARPGGWSDTALRKLQFRQWVEYAPV